MTTDRHDPGHEALSRRGLIAATLAFTIAPLPAGALTPGAAEAHVRATVEAILALIAANQPKEATAKALRELFVQKSALEQLVRYTAGPYWDDMSDAQRERYQTGFIAYISSYYARQFRTVDVSLDQLRNVVRLAGTRDAGRHGVLVTTEIVVGGQVVVSMDWLVSDRSGRVAISDLIVGGISMARTQRDIIVAMFRERDGDPELMIAEFREHSFDLD
ncbi:MAG: ABC transporter substrate-binding protein [Pseudomonadota bacterium]